MVVKIVRCLNDERWYSECIGNCFYAFTSDKTPNIYFVSFDLIVFGEDIEILKK